MWAGQFPVGGQIARWQAGELPEKGQGAGTCGPGSSRLAGRSPAGRPEPGRVLSSDLARWSATGSVLAVGGPKTGFRALGPP